MLIGLTGQIGAGKSTAAQILKDLGACVIEADLIGKQVVETSPSLLKKLARRFGPDVLNPKGKLKRKLVAERAFATDVGKAALDRIVHPYLLKELFRQVRAIRDNCDAVVIDAALLLDWELDKEVDYVLVITASERLRLERMTQRGFTLEDVLARQKSQPSLREYRERATHIVPNNTTEAELRRRLTRLWKQWHAKTD